jgi:amidase
MRFDEYRALDATAMVAGVKSGEFSAQELLDAAARRMRVVNPRINAVILDLTAEATQQAAGDLPRGHLAGVPFLVKDMDGALQGHPCTSGSRALANWVPARDSNLFARYRGNGVLFLGKTNCPEFGILAITEPEAHGITRNPWNLDHTPGGSSGGSAAAVAAGIVPVAHGGDGGGSIRIPAAYCGLFGLKPSRGRMPMGPYAREGWNGLALPHVLTRSVRDSALFLEATHGQDLGAPYGEPAGSTRFVAAVRKPPKRLRIGFSRAAMLSDEVHPDVRPAVDDAASLLEDLGHHVQEVDLRIDVERVTEAYLTITAASVSADVAHTQQQTGAKPRPDMFEQPTWLLSQIGQILSARDLEQALATVNDLTRSVAEQLSGFDMHVSSTTAYPPAQVGELQLSLVERLGLTTVRRVAAVTGPATDPIYRQALAQIAPESLRRTPNTMVFNMTGQPAMSVPLWWAPSGLPVGVQFAGHLGQETLLLQLAGQLEQARPWFDRVAPL